MDYPACEGHGELVDGLVVQEVERLWRDGGQLSLETVWSWPGQVEALENRHVLLTIVLDVDASPPARFGGYGRHEAV